MSYWTRRQEQLKKSAEKSEEQLKKRLEKFYDAEFKRLDKEIAAYYHQYGEDNVITYRNLLQHLSDEDIKLLMERMDDFAEKYPQYASLMPVRESIYRLDRMQGLQYSVYMAEAEIAGYTDDQMKPYLTKLSQQGLNYGMETLGFGKNFYSINSDVVKQFVDVPWCNGENFSTRIWGNTQKLAQILSTDIAQGFARGDSYDKLTRNLQQRFGRVNRRDAYRLIYTEGTYVMAESSMQPFTEDFSQYRISTVGDSRVCPVCRGISEKVFEISERQPGVNFPPFHPWCRCSFEIVVDDWDTWMDDYVAKHSGDRKQAEIITDRLKNPTDGAILTSGARITDTFSPEALRFAELYYDEIRSFSTDAKRIAQNLGKNEEDIREIKAYLFEDKSLYDPDTGEWRRFDPDCAIAQSWQRLMTGKDIKPHDRTLIEHELYEMELKKRNPWMPHEEAHAQASKKYDYRKGAEDYYDSLKKHSENDG